MGSVTRKNRREDILEAGIEVFAKQGYYTTTTAHIAEKAGISQPYVFRFFKTKEELFLAALERAYERILQAFKNVETGSEQLGMQMVQTYEALSRSHPNEVSLQMIGIAITEEAVRKCTREWLTRIRNYVLERFKSAGIENAEREVTMFIAMGILCNITYFIDLPELMDMQPK